MTQEEFEYTLLAFFDVPAKDQPFVEGLSDALYSLNECSLWPDNVDSVSIEQCWFCWKVIHTLELRSFPKELKI